ncbi:hypothetical protein RHGRI_026088 [Rhododendron griersonianum]|uniref:Uncharacterized protein n=1 Tax=Rhododendron griersonianum TaxID=479676 RepID=A0AAV6IRD0_9ERIC|nr:hypothetical protein RHGRI_026088 [Rhododendron griersonianum]
MCKGKPSLEEVILSFPEKERDAPSILRYKPTYQGFIRQKGKKPADKDKPAKKAKVAKQTRQEEKLEEVPEDSFGPLPECLLSSSHRPLRGKIREARDEATDEEGEEIEMSPRNIIADLEERKKKKDEARAKAKTGSSAGGPTVRTIGDVFAREWIEQNDAVISFPTKIPTVGPTISQCFFAGGLGMETYVFLPKGRIVHVEIQPSPSPWSFWPAKTQGQGGPGNVGPSASCRRS